MKAQTLKVPGATLYYETRGAGPTLLLIAGGSGDAGVFEPVAEILTDTYTVATYDPRGNSRSPLNGPPDDQQIEVHSDDARQLLETIGNSPAYVFGSSSGAIVGLDLLGRCSKLVAKLVAHEPPLAELLHDAPTWHAFFNEVYDTYQREGTWTAMQKFAAGIGLDVRKESEGAQVPPQVAEMKRRMANNLNLFFAHEVRSFSCYVPDLTALDANQARIVLAGGQESREYFPYQPAERLAEHFGTQVIDFPGGHVGYLTHPVEFAAKLKEVLTE